MKQPVRILLSEAASRHLTATGEDAFLVASRAMRGTEEPDTMGRWALHLIPCSITQADAAARVALGLSTERKIKTAAVSTHKLKPATTGTGASNNPSDATSAILAPSTALPAHAPPPGKESLTSGHSGRVLTLLVKTSEFEKI